MLHVIGLNYAKAPIAIREKVALDANGSVAMLSYLRHQNLAQEILILSTCNRTEIYYASEDPEKICEWFTTRYRVLAHNSDLSAFYYYQGQDVVRHSFRVASSLDSMVIGESQILGQVKQAVLLAEKACCLGTHLRRLFQKTFEVAKEVRTHTNISRNYISIPAAVVRIAQNIFPDIREQNVLFVGAGEMIALCLAHFSSHTPRSLTIINRSIENAQKMAHRCAVEIYGLSQLAEVLPRADIIISSTASPIPIIGLGLVKKSLQKRKQQPCLFIDLAVPRDVEAEIADLDNIFLYTLDDLSAITQQGLEKRQADIYFAEQIIAQRVEDFTAWVNAHQNTEIIKKIYSQATKMAAREVERAEKSLERGQNPQAVIHHLASALVKKMLHAPTHMLRSNYAIISHELLEIIEKMYEKKDDSKDDPS